MTISEIILIIIGTIGLIGLFLDIILSNIRRPKFYNEVIVEPNGEKFRFEKVYLKENCDTWKITCKDNSIYIIPKENTIISAK